MSKTECRHGIATAGCATCGADSRVASASQADRTGHENRWAKIIATQHPPGHRHPLAVLSGASVRAQAEGSPRMSGRHIDVCTNVFTQI